MSLTPEEKKLGKQNFDEAVGTTRRDFLASIGIVGGTAAAAGLGAKYFGYGPKLDDRLRVGIIGTGDEGSVLIGALNPDYIDVVAIADIRPYSHLPRVQWRLVFARRPCRAARSAEGLRATRMSDGSRGSTSRFTQTTIKSCSTIRTSRP